jgi:predicted ABC-type ATPase
MRRVRNAGRSGKGAHGDESLNSPVCTIFAGPNGPGKTTFAIGYLPNVPGGRNFVNADMIAAELSPKAPELGWPAAGRVFLHRLRQRIECRESFAFETTLAGRTQLKLIDELVQAGWRVQMFYLWVPTVQACVNRVSERVKHGGHDIPHDTILRRYRRSIRNLLEVYAPHCSTVVCYENSGEIPKTVSRENRNGRIVVNLLLYEAMQREMLG